MPHLIIDGYNFIRRIPRFVSAEAEGLESGRSALLLALEEYAALHAYAVTVVFDGGTKGPWPDTELPREDRFAGIDIIFSKKGQSADAAIIELVKEIRGEIERGERAPEGGEIVVTDDFGIRDEAIGTGAFVASPEELYEAMQRGERLRY